MNHGKYADLTHEIIGAAFEVHRTLGPGFLESVYEKPLAYELIVRDVPFERQISIPVYYKNVEVGCHRLDFLVADKVVVELKAIETLTDDHMSVVLSYLSATRLSLALILNFGKTSVEVKRVSK